MYLVDTHTHVYFEDFEVDLLEVMGRAREAGVVALCLPGTESASIPRLKAVCKDYPDCCFPMIGLHPTNVGPDYPKELAILRAELDKASYIAIGEIGIDLHWDKSCLSEQMEAFEEQLHWSIEKDLPVAIHAREAFPQVVAILHKVGIEKLRGVFHSFGGSREELEEVLRYPNFMLGINGVVTYKNAHFRDYLSLAPLERIVLETDAPYLSPVPYRGKRNEPAYVVEVAKKIAEVYGVPVETIAEKTTRNAMKLWKLPPLSLV